MTSLDKTITVRETAGPMSESEAIQWTRAQIPYRNYAGDDQVARRVVAHVNELVTMHDMATRAISARWSLTDYMLSGNTIDKSLQNDTHIPELYKTREAAVPRIESTLLDMDPWFRLRPRHPTKRNLAVQNEALLARQLDQANFRSMMAPNVEDVWTYQTGVIKVNWERRILERIARKVTSRVEGRVVSTNILRRRQRDVVFDGPYFRQVNPYWFLIDPRFTNSRDATFVGDKSQRLLVELMQYQRLGLLLNVDVLVKEQEKGTISSQGNFGLSDYVRFHQNPTARFYDQMMRNPRIMPKSAEVVELWTLFDLLDNGEEIECVLTVANGRTCLRAMENPTDKKIRPYAIARAARSGHGFWGIGPMDNAVRLQIDYDRYAAIAMRIAKLIANPITFADSNVDLPNSIYQLREGEIIKGAGSVNFTRMPNTLEMITFMFNFYERQIAETTGVPKVLEASPTGGTATEAMRLFEEANRRLQGLERRVGEQLNDLLKIMQAFNCQFLVDKTEFPVLGKRGAQIGKFTSVGPESMIEDPDFEIVGLGSMHTYGMRANAYSNIVSQMMPLIQANAANVDTLGILHDVIDVNLGSETADRLIKMPPDPSEYMPQEEENKILLLGQEVEVQPEDDHQDHILKMAPLISMMKAGKLVGLAAEYAQEHLASHIAKMKQQQIEQQVKQKRVQQAQQMNPLQAGGASAAPAGGFEPEAQDGGAVPGKRPGVNPGPPDQAKAGSVGKKSRPQDQSDTGGY